MDTFTLRKIQFDALLKIVAGHCSNALGRRAILQLTPSVELDEVRHRLTATGEMVAVLCDHGLVPLGGISDLADILKRTLPGKGAGCDDYATLAATLDALGCCRAFMHALPEKFPILQALSGGLGDFADLLDAIRAVVGPDGQLRDDASARLRQLRKQIAETTEAIHEVTQRFIRDPDVRKLLTDTNITLHGDRYVLPLKAENRGRIKGVVHRASNTGATLFVEPSASVEMNNKLVDLHDHERQEIDRLLTELAVKVTARRDEIAASLEIATQLDLLNGLAQYAYQNDCTAPQMTASGRLEVHQARHPLLVEAERQQRQDTETAEPPHPVVPIDIRLGADFDILVITGSNTGGKTVTLKTVALLACMAQSGMHLPTQRGATLPIFTDILIEIGDEQSLEQSLSTFGAHVEQLKNIFAKASRSTLVLLDELGSGTDPDEGGAIGQAVLDELQRLGCLAMVTTHFSVLKAYALNHERVDNASVEFDTATLRPTYHLRIGTPGESHAITVAEKLGLGKRIIARAREHLGSRGQAFRQAMRKTGDARKVAEAARSDAAEAKREAEKTAETYEARIADVDRLRAEFKDWLARLGELKPGESIYVPSVKKTGRLARLELHKQIALVDVENLQLEVPLADLMPRLGQDDSRLDVSTWRDQARQASRDAEKKLADAERKLQAASELESQQKLKARQFDTWLSRIARVKVGDTVPIARKPGQAVVKAVNLPALQATVAMNGKEVQLPLQDLFPQTGPFSPQGEKPRRQKGRPRKGRKSGKPAPNAPVQHGPADGKKAARNRQGVLNTPPGEKVYVIPFNAPATLIRIDERKDQAVVSRGAFEMQVALSDVEPMGYRA